MGIQVTTVGTRPLRSDAQRNRDRIREAAAALLPNGSVRLSLEAVAAEAGVGIATLYRHFPTRQDLMLAVYHHEFLALARWADELLVTRPAGDALRQWLRHLAHYGQTRPGLSDAFPIGATDDADLINETYQATVRALGRLLQGADEAGQLLCGVRARDVLLTLAGVWQLTPSPEATEQADRVTTLVLNGTLKSPLQPESPTC